ncbi:MAG: hypothetical protein ACI4WM_00345 [Erysipelotrichaceae bacterium]
MKKLFSILLILLLFTGCSNKAEVKEIEPEKVSMLTSYDSDGVPVSTVVYYDGKEVKKIELNNSNEIDYYVKRFDYNDQGNFTHTETYDADMNLTSTGEFGYQDDIIVYYCSKDESGNVKVELTTEYDDKGLISTQDYLFFGTKNHVMFFYDDNDRLIKEESGTIEDDGELTMDSYTVYEYEGDKVIAYNNNLDDESLSDITVTEYYGNMFNYKKETYDLDNKLISTETVETYDNLISKSYKYTSVLDNREYEYRYDEYGAVIYFNNYGTVYEAK